MPVSVCNICPSLSSIFMNLKSTGPAQTYSCNWNTHIHKLYYTTFSQCTNLC